jgi:hypothetical protein
MVTVCYQWCAVPWPLPVVVAVTVVANYNSRALVPGTFQSFVSPRHGTYGSLAGRHLGWVARTVRIYPVLP